MYNIMIVDDEAIIRNSLRSLLDRMENPRIGEVRCCASSEEALTVCEKWRPDIVITDIVMGERNGIELFGVLRRTLPDARYLVISGYDDFQYARSAFMEGAVDYLLKPVLYPQFKKVIERVFAELDQDETLRLSASLQQFVDDMRSGQNGESHAAGIPGLEASGLVTLAMMAFATANGAEIDRTLTGPACEAAVSGAAVCRRGSTVYLLFSPSRELGEPLTLLAASLPRATSPAIVWETCIAEGIAQCFQRLSKRLARRLREGYGRVFEDDGMPRGEGQSASDALGVMSALIRSVQPGNVDAACESVAELFRRADSRDLERLYQAFTEMTRSHIVERSMADEVYIPPFSLFLTEEELVDAVCTALRALTRLESAEYAGLMDRIQQYIEENYSRRLTLSEVAECFSVSYSHLSHVISKSMGLSFTDWVTSVRMRHARELLYQPTLSVQEIAGLCGYENQFTFTRAFKKYFAVSPSGYRKALENTLVE